MGTDVAAAGLCDNDWNASCGGAAVAVAEATVVRLFDACAAIRRTALDSRPSNCTPYNKQQSNRSSMRRQIQVASLERSFDCWIGATLTSLSDRSLSSAAVVCLCAAATDAAAAGGCCCV